MREHSAPSHLRASELEAEVRALRAQLADAFSVEEMDCIREQLMERAIVAETATEQLEWNLRVELSRVREAEATALHAAREMARVAASIAHLLGESDDDEHDMHDQTQPSMSTRGARGWPSMHA